MNFRYDINGLRAIAVIAVVLFHFNPAWVPGGFAGVDVFFVISGFLMTGIIFKGLENNNFNLFKFYVARANRIIPALAVLCFVVLALGYLLLIQSDSFTKLANHVFSSILFFSNISYYLESGYFDADPKDKWLLHTWSLSVEWQFYILYPIVLVAFKRFLSLGNLKRLIITGTILGFLFSVLGTMKWPVGAYYLLPTRAWEMMMGGVAFLYPWRLPENKKKLVELVGLALILASYSFVSSDIAWPGYFALLPVLGSYLMLVANQQSSFITNNIFFQNLGKWSYSIYLWHWPVVSFSYLYGLKITTQIAIVMFLLSVLLGWVSFVLFEKRKYRYDFLIVLPVIFISVAITQYDIKTFKNRYIESVAKSIERKPYDCFDRKGQSRQDIVVCKLSNGHRKVVALGDSHMYSSLPALEDLSLSNNIELSYVGFSGCPPLLGIYPIRSDQENKNCHNLNKRVMKHVIASNVDVIYLSARWTYYTHGTYLGKGIQYLSKLSSDDKKDRNKSIIALKDGLNQTLKSYSDAGVKVVLLLQVPMQLRNPDKLYFDSLSIFGVDVDLLKRTSLTIDKHKDFQMFTNNLIKEEANKFSNVVLLDPTNVYCRFGHCLVGDEKESFYFDDDHLSIRGSYQLQELLLPLIVN
ncbi:MULTISPECIES: acyltransferase family protein [Vibrio]|jgi:peptidoglycan/LPS O-acetylase OafA/YrhL|uniref:Acyltransferase family protein n=1 Tax=Vibrio kanaloae TaxID=170673 RepID=A0ABV4LCG4_9VIBR|nr:acyltransferase family protein [Vibrio kanaloae]NOI99653.1 acyltransferase [Vibrio kanaloae]OEF13210.1 acyltransferase [Vibrio kanaloae 5S-149]